MKAWRWQLERRFKVLGCRSSNLGISVSPSEAGICNTITAAASGGPNGQLSNLGGPKLTFIQNGYPAAAQSGGPDRRLSGHQMPKQHVVQIADPTGVMTEALTFEPARGSSCAGEVRPNHAATFGRFASVVRRGRRSRTWTCRRSVPPRLASMREASSLSKLSKSSKSMREPLSG